MGDFFRQQAFSDSKRNGLTENNSKNLLPGANHNIMIFFKLAPGPLRKQCLFIELETGDKVEPYLPILIPT